VGHAQHAARPNAMLSSLLYRQGQITTDLDPNEVDQLLLDRDSLLWLDFERPTEDELQIIEREFSLHPLALEDIRTLNQRPKLERYEDHVYLVLYHLGLDENLALHRVEVDVVMGPNYVVSVHNAPVPAISALHERCRRRPQLFEPHPLGFLIYHLADGIVDDYFPLVDAFEERLDQLEERALNPDGRSALGDIFALRKDLIALRNTIEPSRDVFNVLARRDQSFLDESTSVYFTDVYDHLLRVAGRIDGLRELASAALETHLSMQSHELNTTVERLTAITLVLMIVTLITGFCGMNVGFPGRDDPSGLAFALTFMIAIGRSPSTTLVAAAGSEHLGGCGARAPEDVEERARRHTRPEGLARRTFLRGCWPHSRPPY